MPLLNPPQLPQTIKPRQPPTYHRNHRSHYKRAGTRRGEFSVLDTVDIDYRADETC